MIRVITVEGLPRDVRGCASADGGGLVLLNGGVSIDERAEELARSVRSRSGQLLPVGYHNPTSEELERFGRFSVEEFVANYSGVTLE